MLFIKQFFVLSNKYYLSDFNEVTDYKKRKRRMTHQADFLDMTNVYINKKFPESPFEDMGLFIAALVQPKISENIENNGRLQELSKTV